MKEDIFDRLLSIPILQRLKPHRELLLYVFFGGVTTLVNIASFWLFHELLGIHELISNIAAWLITMAAVYTTNRTWVFRSTATGFGSILREILRFLAGRASTLLLDELLLYVFITVLGYPSMPVKIIAQCIVILVNYFISRMVVFKKESDIP